MGIWSTVDINYLSEISDVNDFVDKNKDKEYNMFSLASKHVNSFMGDKFVNAVCDTVQENTDIKCNLIVAEEASFRMERELQRIFTRLGSSVLGIDSKQTLHVFFLNGDDFQEFTFGISDWVEGIHYDG